MTATEAQRDVKRSGLTAAGGWVAIGGSVIHLVLTSIARADVWRDIASAGWWGTVTLRPSAEQLRFAEAFWITPGSFAVPLLALGILVVFSARQGNRVPGVLGWILAIWGVFCASLLPVSGAWLFIVVGALFVAGDRARVAAP
ncbi:DUF6463 family protein [Agromyces albus]|uniref:Uncharacterized protein n=1 Tax=Agromyces albus TaxID=205332 RepID=A0A4Q2L0W8_9MICO|nr:DUF6463 family protein [Agromyces albus]RXZ71664.1 hypothetical protein ESP51_07120 [Agromyces albus]